MKKIEKAAKMQQKKNMTKKELKAFNNMQRVPIATAGSVFVSKNDYNRTSAKAALRKEIMSY